MKVFRWHHVPESMASNTFYANIKAGCRLSMQSDSMDSNDNYLSVTSECLQVQRGRMNLKNQVNSKMSFRP